MVETGNTKVAAEEIQVRNTGENKGCCKGNTNNKHRKCKGCCKRNTNKKKYEIQRLLQKKYKQ